jgi:hypothetical protein
MDADEARRDADRWLARDKEYEKKESVHTAEEFDRVRNASLVLQIVCVS